MLVDELIDQLRDAVKLLRTAARELYDRIETHFLAVRQLAGRLKTVLLANGVRLVETAFLIRAGSLFFSSAELEQFLSGLEKQDVLVTRDEHLEEVENLVHALLVVDVFLEIVVADELPAPVSVLIHVERHDVPDLLIRRYYVLVFEAADIKNDVEHYAFAHLVLLGLRVVISNLRNLWIGTFRILRLVAQLQLPDPEYFNVGRFYFCPGFLVSSTSFSLTANTLFHSGTRLASVTIAPARAALGFRF